jgi:pheromone alpha factor receptor
VIATLKKDRRLSSSSSAISPANHASNPNRPGTMSNGGWPVNSTFDPYTQPFVILGPDGAAPMTAYMGDVLQLQYLATSQGIIFGTQVGLSGLLLVVLLLMTHSDKRKSVVFMLNTLALALVLIRAILSCTELNTIFYNYYNWQLHYYPDGPGLRHAQNLSAATEIFTWALDATIYACLVLQVHIVCITMRRVHKLAVLGVCIGVSLTALGYRMYTAVYNIKYMIFGINSATEAQMNLFEYISVVNNDVTICTIAFFTTIFVAKLAYAIHVRRKLNMKQFGPMQVIFVMGCQTLLVPRK